MAWVGLSSRYVDLDGGVWAVSVKVDEKRRRIRYEGIADPPSRHGHLVFGSLAMNCYGWFVMFTDFDVNGIAIRGIDAGRAPQTDIVDLGFPYIFTNRALDAANQQIEALKTDVVKLEETVKQLLVSSSTSSLGVLEDLQNALHKARDDVAVLTGNNAVMSEELNKALSDVSALRVQLNRLKDDNGMLRSYVHNTGFVFRKGSDFSLPDARTYGWRLVCADGKPSWASVRFSIIDGVLNVRQEGDLVNNYWTDDRPQTLLSRFGDNFELFSWRDGVMFNYTNTPTGVVFTALGYSQHWCVKA
jgi:hypothetical protein